MDFSIATAVRLVHLTALALAVGGATAKNLLLVRCRRDLAFVPTFLGLERLITRQIIVGQVLITISGVAYAWLLGYGFTPRVVVKVVLVAAVWVLGPCIDTIVAPRMRQHAPGPGQSASPAFQRALSRYVFWDLAATGIYYAVIVFWVTMT